MSERLRAIENARRALAVAGGALAEWPHRDHALATALMNACIAVQQIAKADESGDARDLVIEALEFETAKRKSTQDV